MALFDRFRGRDPLAIEEAAGKPTVTPPTAHEVTRLGYVTGIPIGGASPDRPASTTAGVIDRSDFLDQLMQAYLSCPHASAAIDVIARSITAGGIEVQPNNAAPGGGEGAGKGEDEVITPEPPPQVKEILNLLAFVNADEDIRQLMRGVITDLLIFGDSYTEVVWVSGKPTALYTLDPQTMTVCSDEHGVVTGYQQKMTTGRTADFEPYEVIHVKFDTPGGGLYGVSPTNKVIAPITTWLFTEALLKETMKKGDPLRAWVDWPIAMSETEMKRFQQQYAIRNMGSANIGNLLETKGGAEVKELSMNQLTQWMDIKQQARDEIYTGYGVPPSKVGVIEAGNLGAGTGTSQDRMFNVNTCGPIGELVLEKFTFALLQQAYGIYDWHLKFGTVDWRDDMIIEQIADLRIRNGRHTINKSRAIIGEPPIPGGDDAFLVDRQAVVLYRDLDAYSQASVRGVDGTPNPDASPPLSPVGAKHGMSKEDIAVEAPATPTVAPAKPPTVENYYDDHELNEAWQRHYQEQREKILADLD